MHGMCGGTIGSLPRDAMPQGMFVVHANACRRHQRHMICFDSLCSKNDTPHKVFGWKRTFCGVDVSILGC